MIDHDPNRNHNHNHNHNHDHNHHPNAHSQGKFVSDTGAHKCLDAAVGYYCPDVGMKLELKVCCVLSTQSQV